MRLTSLLVLLIISGIVSAQTIDYVQQLKNKPYIDAIQGGADLTGTKDSAAAINTALAKGSVLLPAGTYKINSATLTIPSGTCLQGVGDATILKGTGAFPAVTIKNVSNACLKNVSIQAANDGVLETSTTTGTWWNKLDNVHITNIADTHIGVHTVAGVGGNCGSSGICIYYSDFTNVIIDGGSAAPSVGTRVGYQLDGDGAAAGNIGFKIIGGTIRNVQKGLVGNSYSRLFMYGTGMDSMCTHTCNQSYDGTGVAISLLGAYAQSATLYPRIEVAEIDQGLNMTSGSYLNTIHVNLQDTSVPLTYTADAGIQNCIWDTGGDATSTNNHDYCFRSQQIGNTIIPSGYALTLNGYAASTLSVGGLLTAAQEVNPGIVTIQAPNSTVPAITLRGNSANVLMHLQSKDYSESATTGNQCIVTAYGIPYCEDGQETNTEPMVLAGANWIATETGSNNAIAGTLGTYGPPLQQGLTVHVVLAHSLQAGGNTFNYASSSAYPIKSAKNVSANIATGWSSGGEITLMFSDISGNPIWLDISQ